MAGIRSGNTLPETMTRSALHKRGFRFARSSLGLAGKPDIVLPRWKVLVFVHGCFWHMHGCRLSRTPDNNRDFWVKKLTANKARDERTNERLAGIGWRILTIWECAMRGSKERGRWDEVMDEIALWIRGQSDGQYCTVSSTGLTFSKDDIKNN